MSGSGPSSGIREGMGPIRVWPGGVMLSRVIGDYDVSPLLLPHPHIKQVCVHAAWGVRASAEGEGGGGGGERVSAC
jgi:hypothetical protein